MIIKLYHLNNEQKDYLRTLERERGDDIILLETRLSPTDSQFDLLISFGADPETLSCEIVRTLIGFAEEGDEEKLLCPAMKVNEGRLFSLVPAESENIYKLCRGE